MFQSTKDLGAKILYQLIRPVYSGNYVSKYNYIKQLSFKLPDYKWRCIQLHINEDCNLRCSHCYSKEEEGDLSTKEIFSLLKQLKKGLRNRSLRLDILGGEPLLRNDFFEIISYAKMKVGIGKIQLYTNGTMITEDVAKRIKRAGVDVCMITLHSHIKELHDDITGSPDSWEKTIRGIKASHSAGIETYSFTIISSQNITDLKALDLLVRRIGAKTFFFPVIAQKGCGYSHISDKKAFQAAISWAFNKNSSHKKGLIHSLRLRGKACSAFVNTIAIKSNGAVIPCAFTDLELGNIKQDRLYAILNKSFLNKELVEFLSIPEECKECSLALVCGGGCKAFRYTEFRDTKSKDPNCAGPFGQEIDLEYCGDHIPFLW